MLAIINILLIVGILLFILYNIYVDTRNWSNTGSFIEGMDNIPQKGTFISNEGTKWKDQKPFKVSENIYVFGGKDGGWFKMASVDSNGKFIENRYTKECNSIEELTIEIWNRGNKGGDYKVEDIVLVSVEPTPPPTNNLTSQEVMNRRTQSRAGIIDPIKPGDSYLRPSKCLKGCVAPNGPDGNCENIRVNGKLKKNCYHGCPVPSFKRNDTINCKYDQDCKGCEPRKVFDPDAPPNMPGERPGGYCPPGQDCDPKKGHPVDGNDNFDPNDPNSWVGSVIDVKGINNAPGLFPLGSPCQPSVKGNSCKKGECLDEKTGNPVGIGQAGRCMIPTSNNTSYSNNQSQDFPSSVATSNDSLFDENIMKQVLEKKDLIPGDINSNNEGQSFNLRVGKNFMVNTASIRNFALPNIENQDYIELGRIVKNIKMREKDPRDVDQVKALYSKLNVFVLELLTDSSLDMSSYDNSGMPNQLNNKTRTTGMFGENSNSLLRKRDTYDDEPASFRQCRGKIKCYDSIWGLN